MCTRITVSLLVLLSIFPPRAFSQLFSLNDTTVIYKNQEGKILTKDELHLWMKETFLMKKENINGKVIDTLLLTGNSESKLQLAKMEAFKNTLLNKPLPAFDLTDLDNITSSLPALKGKIVVMNFWFTSCKTLHTGNVAPE